MITVEFDDQIFSTQTRGGISRYFFELMKSYEQDPSLGVAVERNWRYSVNDYVLAAGMAKPVRFGPTKTRLGRLTSGSMALALNSIPRRGVAQLVHTTHYRNSRLPPPGLPMVVTVHDMIPEMVPEYFGRRSPHHAKHKYLQRASAVVCVSESTKRDLIRTCGDEFQDSAVVPLAVDYNYWSKARRRPDDLPSDYLLFVGDRRGYKDFRTLAEAFSVLCRRHPKLWLVAIGGGSFTSQELRNFDALRIRDRAIQRTPPDSGLASAYASAQAFVFPSRYEGFGLPTLEAMAAGAPVVLARSSSHVEVGGNAAEFFDPGDVRNLRDVLDRILADEGHRSQLAVKGRERAKSFSWGRVARMTATVYSRLLRHHWNYAKPHS